MTDMLTAPDRVGLSALHSAVDWMFVNVLFRSDQLHPGRLMALWL